MLMNRIFHVLMSLPLMQELLGKQHIHMRHPWYTGDFTTTYSDIVRGCEGFLTFLEQEGKL